jgi:hypothetical protein
MKLFEQKGWDLKVSEEAWGLVPFGKMLKRDKSTEKQRALKEALFVYFWCDIRSNYIHMSEEDKLSEIKKDIGLPATWKKDAIVDECIELYTRVSSSVIEQLYIQSLKSAQAIGDYLENAAVLLAERDNNGRPVNDISKITNANEKIPKLMRNLKEAYKEVVKEREDNDNKKKGSKQFNTFEDGIGI